MRGQSQTLIFSWQVLVLMLNGSLINYPNLIRINHENLNPIRYLKPIGQCTDLSHCERKWSGRKIGLRRENWILWVSRQEITLRSFVTQETTLSEPRIRNGLFPFHPLAIIIISIKNIVGSFQGHLWYMISQSPFKTFSFNDFNISSFFCWQGPWCGCHPLNWTPGLLLYFLYFLIVFIFHYLSLSIFLYFPVLLLAKLLIWWPSTWWASWSPPFMDTRGSWVAFTELLFQQNWPSFHYTAPLL